MAIIKTIYKNSPFYEFLKKGDNLIAINDKEIKDLLDYMFILCEGNVKLTIQRNGSVLNFEAMVTEDDLRLEFEDYLMDNERHCANKCIFCFIDQLPKEMRNTLYYKDDDFRLSLLYGNYVTLTNLSENDIERIIAMKVSPLNISVHTTDPDLRVKMMANPKAGGIFDLLKRFAAAEINMRCQIVLCKGINDGDNLEKIMIDLKSLHPYISSVSIVPVGLTKYREGLFPLEPFNAEDAKKIINQVDAFGDKTKEALGTRIFYNADEFYLKAGITLPGYSYYEEFEQIENGVGMMISFAQEFKDLMGFFKGNDHEINISIATGVSAKPFFETIINGLKKRLPNFNCSVYEIKNNFFGENITVAGLITGMDLISQLKEKQLGNYLLIPSSMLRDNKFLDDVSVREVEKALKIKIKKTGTTAEELVNTILKSGNNK